MEIVGTLYFIGVGALVSACSSGTLAPEPVSAEPTGSPVGVLASADSPATVSASATASLPADAEGDQKATDCEVVTTAINASVEQLKEIHLGGGDPLVLGRQLREFARLAEQTAQKLGSVAIHTEQLKALVDEYIVMANEIVAASTNLAVTMDRLAEVERDTATKPQAELLDRLNKLRVEGDLEQKKMGAATDKEDPLVDRINQFCGTE